MHLHHDGLAIDARRADRGFLARVHPSAPTSRSMSRPKTSMTRFYRCNPAPRSGRVPSRWATMEHRPEYGVRRENRGSATSVHLAMALGDVVPEFEPQAARQVPQSVSETTHPLVAQTVRRAGVRTHRICGRSGAPVVIRNALRIATDASHQGCMSASSVSAAWRPATPPWQPGSPG